MNYEYPYTDFHEINLDYILKLARESLGLNLVVEGNKLLLKNNLGETAFTRIIQYGATSDVFNILIKAGADINAIDNNGRTPLFYVARYSKTAKTVEALLKLGADINTRDNNGDTPLFMAAYGNKNPEVIKALLEYGADVNIRDDSGKTALEYTYKNYRVRKILLHYKEQINRIDKRKIIK